MDKNRKLERERNIRLANESMRKARIRMKLFDGISSFFRVVFCTPLATLFKALAVIFGVLGKISSVAILIGFFYGYLAYKEINAGASIGEVKELLYAVGLIVLPFIMYAFHFIAEKLNDFFHVNSLK